MVFFHASLSGHKTLCWGYLLRLTMFENVKVIVVVEGSCLWKFSVSTYAEHRANLYR